MNMYTLISNMPIFPILESSGPGKYVITVQASTITDSYHTMDELYEHRIRLWLALVKIYDNYITPLNCQIRCWKSRKHQDGTTYEGWFVLGMTVIPPPPFNISEPCPPPYMLSYHIPDKYWDVARVVEMPRADYDGHTSNDVLERLFRL